MREATQVPARPREREGPIPGESTAHVGAAAPVAPRGVHALGRLPVWARGLLPLALLAILLLVFFRWGPLGMLGTSFPPVEELTIERVWMPEPGIIQLRVVNGGPEPVTVSQVLVDDAMWSHTLDGDRTLDRLDSRTVRIPYPWVEGEPHDVTLVTTTGLTFDATVDVATQAPAMDARYLGSFALVGVYVGVVPVLLGLFWLPFLRALERRWVDFFLAFTVGLLVFLGVDALVESAELSTLVPGAFMGSGLVLLGLVGTPLLLEAVGGLRRTGAPTAFRIALLVALAIGLHNLGEGLAIGGAYASGAVALGTFLIVGFLIHNTTEGLAIVAPLARDPIRLRALAGLGLLAGAPTILGAWLGGFGASPLWATLFLAIGAGAVAQVVFQLARMFRGRQGQGLTSPLNAAGVLLGLAVMYATGLLVAS
jgi:zinc transporter ZupT